MIIGGGLIANAFKSSGHDAVIIFASGVANSNETRESEYLREKNLLKQQDKNKLLIYFSTMSVEDTAYAGRRYIGHKLEMENYVSEHWKSYLIFRLPIVVGISRNPNTLPNFFYNRIINREQINVLSNAVRYLIGVEELVEITSLFILSGVKNLIADVCYEHWISPSEIVACMGHEIGIDPRVNLVDGGSKYAPTSWFNDFLPDERKMGFPDKYNFYLITNFCNQRSEYGKQR